MFSFGDNFAWLENMASKLYRMCLFVFFAFVKSIVCNMYCVRIFNKKSIFLKTLYTGTSQKKNKKNMTENAVRNLNCWSLVR